MSTMKRGFLLTVFWAVFAVSCEAAMSIAGSWETQHGDMELQQEGNKITGNYSFGGNPGTIEATIEGRVVHGQYRYRDRVGEFTWKISEDGRSFDGNYSRTGSSGTWWGKRRSSLPEDSSQTTDSKGRIRRLGDGLTQYTIWSTAQDGSGDSSGQTINMGKHTYCALTYVMSGGFQSACAVTVHGEDWILKARDPGPPDPYAAESQGCSAICFDR